MKIFKSTSENDTFNAGKWLAKRLKGSEVIAFYGEMGAGKTAFTRGIADFFDLGNEVCSPTFSILNVYASNNISIYHFDIYRIKTIADLESAGFFDYLNKGIIIIEWSENLDIESLCNNIIKISIKKLENFNEREIKIDFGSN
ncbi:MAG: tRNA (adenosine(37)-N6)-threonylcarbamoyltransferase complex ATPase subunit type 1 TsaE [Oscillospiraceae bacterium]|jgi:tRNA threonylcarbamoyladenosine biosynthesis protein TsaE|nr:tRNA (adenosine(37)-N6)-threonylcarbamoyltransferase complex ATPase subunit type 1 TsaE [Oscillospiraceae bacterium]